MQDALQATRDLRETVGALTAAINAVQDLARTAMLDAGALPHVADVRHWDYAEHANLSSVMADMAHVYDAATALPNPASPMSRAFNAGKLLDEILSDAFGTAAALAALHSGDGGPAS